MKCDPRNLITFLSLISSLAFGTHLKSIQIEIQKLGDCTGKVFAVTLRVYVSTLTEVHPGGGTLDFGDGTILTVPELSAIKRPDLGTNIGIASHVFVHEYSSHGDYKISYTELNRNSGILNINNSVLVPYSTFASIKTYFGCNSFPQMLVAPIDDACSKVAFFHSPGAIDADGDSLHFEFVTPLSSRETNVNGYLSPINSSFYEDFSKGNEEGSKAPTIKIETVTGLISWDAPGKEGEYILAFKMEEWRTDGLTSEPILLSTTIRDMMVVVFECSGKRPILSIPEDLCIEAGTIIDENIIGLDPDHDDVKIEMVSEIFNLSVSPAVLSPSVVEFRSSTPPDTVKLHWRTDCQHVREQPYQVVVKITDSPRFGPPQVTFKTWRIKIIAPAITWKSISLDLINRRAVLEWESYACSNAHSIQIWRKVGHYNYNPGSCISGISRYIGYELIGEVDPSDTIFRDNNSVRGLVDGALYCYRLVAIFAQPAGGKSYVTFEQCAGPILTDAPVITNVSVEDTDKIVGTIRISWRSPFKIDKTLFPKPYQYHLYRGYGFDSEVHLQKVGEVLADTTFLDASINTADSTFNYRIIVYSKPAGYPDFIPVDTSFAASSVRLSGISGKELIELDWEATVPWSNTIEGSPFHHVYRGPMNAAHLNLLAITNITEQGFYYLDQTVATNEYYCYRVMTRGTYGTSLIDTIKNYSQRVCLYPKNELVPCAPLLFVDRTDCDDFIGVNHCEIDFKNELSWTPASHPGCRVDIVSYNVYASSKKNEDYELIAQSVVDTTFTELNLPSYARCYRVTSVDSRGYESDLGEIVCNDNCPFFELPNVFTPGAQDGCNDTFRAYNGFPSGDSDCSSSSSLCLLFVNNVSFKVYNRWGKEVFSQSTINGLPATIEWRGVKNTGDLLESGIYYYWAEVDFNVLDDSKRTKKLKGWVSLVR